MPIVRCSPRPHLHTPGGSGTFRVGASR